MKIKNIVAINIFILAIQAESLSYAQQNSPIEMRQIQTRQFKTNNVDKVTDIVQEAFMDMGYIGGGNSYWHMEYIGSKKYSYNAVVNIGQTPDGKYVLVRINYGPSGHSAPQKGNEIYSELFSAIGKSAFYDSQRLSLLPVNE